MLKRLFSHRLMVSLKDRDGNTLRSKSLHHPHAGLPLFCGNCHAEAVRHPRSEGYKHRVYDVGPTSGGFWVIFTLVGGALLVLYLWRA